MTQRHSSIVSDDELVRIARRYRRESIATLITICRNESAPASARAQASAKLLEYSDGKPGQAEQITVADIGQMSPELRSELLHALLLHWEVELPGQFKLMMKASVDEAIAKQAALPKPNRFSRGPRAQAALKQAPAFNQPAKAISAEMSAKVGPPACSYAATPPTAERAANARAKASPDNVVVMPGGLAEHLEHTQDTTPNPHGGIHPSVVRRSALKDPWRP